MLVSDGSTFSLFPNIVKEGWNITIDAIESGVGRITNVMGHEVLQVQLVNGNNLIDVSVICCLSG